MVGPLDRIGPTTGQISIAVGAGTGVASLVLHQLAALGITTRRTIGRSDSWALTLDGVKIAAQPIEALARVWGGDLSLERRKRPVARARRLPWHDKLARNLYAAAALTYYANAVGTVKCQCGATGAHRWRLACDGI